MRRREFMQQAAIGMASVGLSSLPACANLKRVALQPKLTGHEAEWTFVGGKDWTERRLYERIRACSADFVLLRQARREAISSTCDLGAALLYIEQLASMQIRIRHLAQPSPFGESLLDGGIQATTIPGSVRDPVESR